MKFFNKSEKNKSKLRVLGIVATMIFAITIGIFMMLSNVHADYTPVNSAESYSETTISFNNVTQLIDYSWYYKNNTNGFASTHQNDILIMAFSGDYIIDNNFSGIGTSDFPFGGTVRFGGADYIIRANDAFFNYVYDSVKLLNNAGTEGNPIQENVVFVRLSNVGENESKPLFAKNVIHDTRDGKTPASWQMECSNLNKDLYTKTYSGLIGAIGKDAVVNLTYTNNSIGNISSNADAGAVCGVMQAGSSLTLSYSGQTGIQTGISVNTSSGNAGGLIGTMNSDSSLTISALPSLSFSPSAESGYAGGLIGELTSDATITNSTGSVISIAGTVTGSNGAGGLFGHYTNKKTVGFDLKDYNITSTVYGQYCGGVFGLLENENNNTSDAISLTIKNTGNAGTVNIHSGTAETYKSNGYFGGLIGKYTTNDNDLNDNDLKNSLIIDGLTITANSNAQYCAFGGAIGLVNSAAYIKTNQTVTINATGTNKSSTYFGGLVGDTSSSNGVFVDLNSFTLSNNSEEFIGGGIVGRFYNGVLRLSGTTNLSNAKSECAANCGQLVGINDNVLVYAPGSWTFNRSNNSETDDLGTWGEVVRLSDIENGVLTFDSTNHTVTVSGAQTTMKTPEDFAKTALNIQLNQGSNYDCLIFTSGNNTRSYLLASNLTLSSSSSIISLANTGLTGFMRDGGSVDTIGVFTGTLNGGGNTITLAIGETYGVGDQIEGKGQIYRHQHNGLFAVLAGTVENLTVDGTINVRNRNDSGTMSIGGIASRNGGNVTLTSVNANETINYHESENISFDGNENKTIGGYIGYIGVNGKITINGTSSIVGTLNFSGHKESWNTYGGAIGIIKASTFTITIGATGDSTNKLTNSFKMDNSDVSVTNVGGNTDGGGLIGYITNVGSYGDRIVNINNLEYYRCELANFATTQGGGLLGYSWLNTTANIKGITVTSATINNYTTGSTSGGNVNLGVLCYSASGKWTVDSLNVQSLTINDGCSTSLGLIVNKAYDSETKSNTDGLYLDVLNAGYILNGANITLPSSIVVYDEIAAYSAKNVINGGDNAGVISINMNSNRDESTATATITTTGTYQNKLTSTSSSAIGNSKYANPNSRYYYNLDVLNNTNDVDVSDKTNVAHDLLLWSLNKYAASNIKSEFVPTSSPLTGTADMTGLSFYPLAYADNIDIGSLDLKFDYSGLYGTAESTFGDSNPTDGYVRDPALSNQHYLMHSGLFINQSAGNTLNISGALSLGGTFMEDDSHKGVLISGTMYGNLDCSGSIKLDGIKPMKGDSSYKDGYLLINNVQRQSEQVSAPYLVLKNVYTTNKYPTLSNDANSTDTVAKSLIGAASGKGLHISLSNMKLDARDGTKADVKLEDLYNAYGTYNSIFTDSTMFASIKTDSTASLEYNYTYVDDWGTGNRNVTYGKEVKGSVEYLGKENKYYGETRNYTNPIDNSNKEYDFSKGFLPYVYEPFEAINNNNIYSRELKVNVMATGLETGCGSYNDPYVISNGEVLESVASFILNGSTSSLTSVNLPNDYEIFNTLTKNTSGNRFCTDTNGNNYHSKYTPNSDGTGGYKRSNGTDLASVDNVRYYLANAYYVIDNDTHNIKLSETYVGLGGNKANFAFRGVIVGKNNVVITNNSSKPFINVSNGCVVKDINVVVNNNIELEQTLCSSADASFDYESKCSYYGGIIGEIMGGDNIIDNCYITYASGKKITLSGSYGMLCPVGSYVGVVVYGGLIFKNMNATKVNSNANTTNFVVNYTGNDVNLTATTSKGAIYVNPIVGRVINGYAVNESTQFSITENGHYHDDDNTTREGVQHSIKNGTKHYTIADLNKDEEDMLDVTDIPTNSSTDGIINIPNSQAFFVLSLITQSCAGTATTADGDYDKSLSYGTYSNNVFGMSHNAEYTNVGDKSLSESDDDYVLACSDTADNTAVPYIIKYYTVYQNRKVSELVEYEKYVDYIRNDMVDLLDGHKFLIANTINNKTEYITREILENTNAADKPKRLQDTLERDEAAEWYFEKTSDNKYYIYTLINGTPNYMWIYTHVGNNKHLTLTTDINNASKMTLRMNSNGDKFAINCAGYIDNWNGGVTTQDGFAAYNDGSIGNNRWFTFYLAENISKSVEKELIGQFARNVTSALGYYDISLKIDENYILPDSFRGLGCVGNRSDNYAIKLDKFNGNNKTIDVDIYLNRFGNTSNLDNYFDTVKSNNNTQTYGAGKVYNANQSNYDNMTQSHGIGLFDSVIMKDETSMISNFVLTGSVNTENYDLSTNSAGMEKKGVNNNKIHWLCVGGVCGWSIDDHWCNFNKIILSNLTVSGATQTGGIIGDAGLVGEGGADSRKVTITECSADEITVEITSAYNSENYRSVVGAFVGKCDQGRVIINGGDSGKTVKIKAIKIGVNNLQSLAGGLVAFAGNGCEVYNMTVCPADSLNGKSITIGDTGVSMVGGIIGLMQPASAGATTCTAVFENCIIENINISANEYAGGLYGGTWNNNNWSPYSISVVNCKMVGNSTTKNTIIANLYAGGLVADGYVVSKADEGSYNIEIANSIVSNYNIYTTGDNTSAGGFIGYANAYSTNSIVCYIHDSSVENCTLGASEKYAGGAIGEVAQNTENKLLGYNIKLKNIESGTTKIGAWIGNATDDADGKVTKIQFVGLAIYGQGFTKNIGNNATISNASFVFADYTGKCEGTTVGNNTTYPTNISGYNSDATHVDMPNYPYVNINPQSSMGSDAYITSDGAVLYDESVPTYSGKTSAKTMAAKIYDDISNNNNTRRYTTFTDSDIYGSYDISDYLERTTSNDGDRISTYETEKGSLPIGVTDFAVVVIANTNNEETTNLINRYIQLVTNTSTDYTKTSDYYNIVVSTCKYEDGDFIIDTSATNHGLLITSVTESGVTTNTFALNNNYADSVNSNKFTLIDVQFKDPLNTSKIAYHLYVPVYTIRQIEVNFSSAVQTGTRSVSYNENNISTYYSELMSSNGKHVESLNTWYTQYVRFTYQAADINTLLSNHNVKWNSNKEIILKTGTSSSTFMRLPNETKMILVDPNGNADKMYYVNNMSVFDTYEDTNYFNKQGWLIEFDKFIDTSNNNFAVQTINDLIAKDIIVEAGNEYKEIKEIRDSSDYDVYVIVDGKTTYYKYDPENGTWHLSVDENYVLNEDYYISAYVPNSNLLFFYDIISPTELNGNSTIKVNQNNIFTVIVANLYSQTNMTFTVQPDEEQISASNKKITLTTSVTIDILNADAKAYLSDVDLFHSFNISLDRHYGLSDVKNDIIGLTTNSITATYSLSGTADSSSTAVSSTDLQTNYLNLVTANIMSNLLSAVNNNGTLTITGYAELDFDENKLQEEFPQKESQETIGVNVGATSNLAYAQNRLAYTSMMASFSPDSHYYYIESNNSAILQYNVVHELDEYDTIGEQSQNYSRLGINGFRENCSIQNNMPIITEAKYNASAIADYDLSTAEKIRLVVTLSKKEDIIEEGVVTGVEYSTRNNLSNYFSGNITVTSGDFSQQVAVPTTSSFTIDIPKGQCEVDANIYTFNLTYNVKTKDGFTEYANYRITLEAVLVYDDGGQTREIERSGATDYIIYTNAKVYPTVIPRQN